MIFSLKLYEFEFKRKVILSERNQNLIINGSFKQLIQKLAKNNRFPPPPQNITL